MSTIHDAIESLVALENQQSLGLVTTSTTLTPPQAVRDSISDYTLTVEVRVRKKG